MLSKQITKRAFVIVLTMGILLCALMGMTVPANADITVSSYPLVSGNTLLSPGGATWILDLTVQGAGATTTYYTLQNKMSGLYLTLRSDGAGGYALTQETLKNGTPDSCQQFNIRPSDGASSPYCFMQVLEGNVTIYTSNNGAGFLFQSGAWNSPPGGAWVDDVTANGAKNINNAVFNIGPGADGKEVVLKCAGTGGNYIQSKQAAVTAVTAEQGAATEWLFTLVAGTDGTTTARYSVINALTGLALTSTGSGTAPVQEAYTGASTQKWGFRYWYGYTILKNDDGKTLITNNGAAQTGTESDSTYDNYGGQSARNAYLNNGTIKPHNGIRMLLMFSLGSYLASVTDGFEGAVPPQTVPYAVVVSGQAATASDTWIMEFSHQYNKTDAVGGTSTTDYYKIKNKETGLYLELDNTGGQPCLYQAAASDSAKQMWIVVNREGYPTLVTAAYNLVLYMNANQVALQKNDSSNWYLAPSGFQGGNAYCKWYTSWSTLTDGAETKLQNAGTGTMLRSPFLKGQHSVSVDAAAEANVTASVQYAAKDTVVTVSVQAPGGQRLKAGMLWYTVDGGKKRPMYMRTGSYVYDDAVTTLDGHSETITTYFFKMPEGDVKIYADFVPETSLPGTAAADSIVVFGTSYRNAVPAKNLSAGLQFGSRIYREIKIGSVTYTLKDCGTIIKSAKTGNTVTVPSTSLIDRTTGYVDIAARINYPADKEPLKDTPYSAKSYANYMGDDGQPLYIEAAETTAISFNEFVALYGTAN